MLVCPSLHEGTTTPKCSSKLNRLFYVVFFFLLLFEPVACDVYTECTQCVCAHSTHIASTGIKTSLRQHAFNRGDMSSAAHTNKNGEELHPASSCQTEAKAPHVRLYLKEKKQQTSFPPIHCFCSFRIKISPI